MINLNRGLFWTAPFQSCSSSSGWGDFVLYLLANLPNQVVTRCSDVNQSSGGSMVGRVGFMRPELWGAAREMLVMIRIWGLLKPAVYHLHARQTTRTACSCCSGCSQAPSSAGAGTDESPDCECCLLPQSAAGYQYKTLPVSNPGVIVRGCKTNTSSDCSLEKLKSLPGRNHRSTGVFTALQRMDQPRCVPYGSLSTGEAKPGSPNKAKRHEAVERWIKNCLWGGLWRIPRTLLGLTQFWSAAIVASSMVCSCTSWRLTGRGAAGSGGFRCHDRGAQHAVVDGGDSSLRAAHFMDLPSYHAGGGSDPACSPDWLARRGSINAGGCNFSSFLGRLSPAVVRTSSAAAPAAPDQSQHHPHTCYTTTPAAATAKVTPTLLFIRASWALTGEDTTPSTAREHTRLDSDEIAAQPMDRLEGGALRRRRAPWGA
ncbi:mediator of RNA polymerase II transcription subunit 16 isoform X2 [Lates japonicus]|uniref:Mediator of RNA polymerase II transcription subunit 16 isoform X2 n=1 Tax=Lates japonicus TaxID=270547 RepID=A0AAD3NCE4_LATJO|nr:mediator of RNA polymerase II transcription subunit 16 isoform X2 [Lates japonicus]